MDVRLSDWAEAAGSNAWLPAYGFQHEVDKEDFYGSTGECGSSHALYLETIVEETSDDLRSERSCGGAGAGAGAGGTGAGGSAAWLSDSDGDSVLAAESDSEREWACPAKRRRRDRPASPASPASNDSLSRSSSLAQFESLERSCRVDASPSTPSLSPDSLESAPSSPRAHPPPARTHLSAENLSEDSGYSERARPATLARQTEIARRGSGAGGASAGEAGGSAPCLACSVERWGRAGARAASLPALHLCAPPAPAALAPAAPAHHPHAFAQRFRLSDALTVSVADLTALDYRAAGAGAGVGAGAVVAARRPRHPPPPPPPRRPPPPPPPPPAREPSASSDSTTESERAFVDEMEATARRLDEAARRALQGGDYARDLSVLTARRLNTAWGVWDDVLDELRRRIPHPSPTPSPDRSPSRTPSLENLTDKPKLASTPLRSQDARVRSTPELRARVVAASRDTPEELRASLQHVAAPARAGAAQGEVRGAPPARSVSTGSKGVTFSPVVAEVSWREASASTSTSASSCGREPSPSPSASDDGADAEVEEVGGAPSGLEAGAGASAQCARAAQCAHSPRAAAMQDARAPRSRIAGFLSRFANFRFSGRKSEKKTRSAGAGGRVPDGEGNGRVPGAPSPHYVHIPLKEEPRPGAGAGPVAHKPPRPARSGPRAHTAAPAPSPAPGVLETDVDTARTVLHARSLLALPPPDQQPHRPHKSMEFLLDKESALVAQPPENDLQKNSDRVLSEHELRVQKSLQKLNVPEWYKNTPTPREGFLLRKRYSDASSGAARWAGLNSKTTSLGSLGGALAPPSQLSQLSPATTSFGRWSTSRLNSNTTSPCSSARSSVRGASPLCSPSARSSFSARQPYLGWRSQERLTSTPRTPHERLACSLLQNSNSALNSSKASEEIQTSIKEVTSAIVHYVSGLEPSNGDIDRESSPRSSQKLFWLESSFVGTKPVESPQTPLVASESLPPPPAHPHPRPPAAAALRLDLQRPAPDWQEQDRSLLNLNICRASPGSTTLEDVLDSLLGLPSAPNRHPTPQASPRKAVSPYYQLSSKGPKYEQLSNSSATSRTFNQSSPSDDFQFSQRSTTPLSEHSAPGKDTVDKRHNTSTMQESNRRPRSAVGEYSRRRSEPFSAPQAHSLDRRTSVDLSRIQEHSEPINSTKVLPADSKTSFHSVSSINTENMNTDDGMVRCMFPKCVSKANLQEAKKCYKVCHNCNYLYCSRECRRAHWEKHRKVCLHSRVSNLCRQIISTAKERSDCLLRISKLAFQGYTAIGRGVVKLFFANPETAEKFVNVGYEFIGEPEYVKWVDLEPGEMGVELYTEVVRLCKTYSPDSKFILFAVVCVLSEVPTKGAVKWERQLVSRCAKLRLSRSVTDAIKTSSSALTKQDKKHRKENNHSKHLKETLIFSSKRKRCNNTAELRTYRKACLYNIEKEFQHRGVDLKKDYPELFSKLMAFVDGTIEMFLPITICPKDVDGKTLICVMMLETDDNITVAAEEPITRIDVGRDIRTDLDSLSTPM